MELNFKKVAVIYNPDIEGTKEFGLEIAKKFQTHFVMSVTELLAQHHDISMAIVVGGDGTLLKCVRFCAPLNIPVFGFNMGRLGFLAQAKPTDLDLVFDKIKNKEFRIEKRLMLKAQVPPYTLTALNDIVIKGAVFSRTSTLSLYINNSLVSNYLADGLIVSTPTGSTAYTLSAGGPVMAPNLDSFVIVPICPHTLSARPLVVPSSEKIQIRMSDCDTFKVTADGQNALEVSCEIMIEKHENSAKLVLLNKDESGFYDILREKLLWGVKPLK